MGGFFLSVASSNFRDLSGTPWQRGCNLNGISFMIHHTSLVMMKPTINQKMGVSENSGTLKSSILMGFSIINHPFWSIPIVGNTQMAINFHPCFLKILRSQAVPKMRCLCCSQGGEICEEIRSHHQFLISEQYPNPKFNMVHLKMGDQKEVWRFRIWITI